MKCVWIVCGSRTFNDYPFLRASLDRLVEQHGAPTVIVNGAMMGADAMSSYWAYQHKIDTDAYGAQWGLHGGSGGPRRNTVMAGELNAASGLDRCIAFTDKPLAESRGTVDMYRKAVGVLGVGNVHHFQTGCAGT